MLLRSDDQHQLIMEFVEVPERYNRIWLRIPAQPTEAVYGGGEQFTYFNLRGRDYPIWVREQGPRILTCNIGTFFQNLN